MANRKNRNGKIDFLKFLFAVIVLIHHSRYVVGDKNSLFLGGSLAVEFYFLVSGYLMMASIRKLGARTQSLGAETGAFLLKKYKSFCPEILIVYVISFVVNYIASETTFFKLLATSFSDILLVGMTGLRVKCLNSAIWYLSSMLLCMAILYPLLRKFGDTALNIIIPILSLMLLGWFCGNKETPRNPSGWIGWTYRGNLRAFAELGIGACLYPIVKKLKKTDFTIFGRILLTIAEYACYTTVILYMYFEHASRMDYFNILLFALALIISFSQKGIDTAVFNGRFSWLGRFSFSVYLSHFFYSTHIADFFPNFSQKKLLAIYYGVSLVTALVVMLLSDAIRKYGSKLNLKRLFVRPGNSEQLSS